MFKKQNVEMKTLVFVILCFAAIGWSQSSANPQTSQKLVSSKTDLKTTPEENVPNWVKNNPRVLHVEPLGSMVNSINFYISV